MNIITKCEILEGRIGELEEKLCLEQEAKEKLRISEQRYRIIMEQSDDIMFEWSFSDDEISFSDKYQEVFGREPHGTMQVSENSEIRRYIHPEDKKAFEEWIRNTYKRDGGAETTFRIANEQGQYLWMKCSTTVLYDENGQPEKAVGVLTSIHAQKQLLEDLKKKAQRDPLTGLLNKTEYGKQVDCYIKECPEETGALFMIDVDNFKDINDNLGHQTGDTVLQEIADNIKSIFPETKIIGRIGGDEFSVYLPNYDRENIDYKADALAQILRLSYFGSVTKYEISGSIGFASYPENGKEYEELYHYADIALYHAKKSGKNQVVRYQEDIESQLLDNRTPVEYSSDFLNTYFQNDVTFHVFSMLYETKDVSASIHMILELLGKRFGVDRVYIFEEVENGLYLRNTYEWCTQGVNAQIHNLQNLPVAMLSSYFSEYSEEGVFCCEDIAKLSPEVYDICNPQGIKSLLHCAIYDEGVKIGFIGFDLCREYHSWSGDEIAVLGYISRILSVFMVKNVVTDQLKTSHQNYAGMVENLNGFVYVINQNDFEVLFVNRAMRELGIEPGKLCYDMAFGAVCQCENCPIRQMNENTDYAMSEVYSEILREWVNASASRMKWEGTQDAILVCCTDISQYKK